MPQEEIDVILAEYAAMSRGDWPDVFSRAHPDFEFKGPDRGLGGGSVTRGREQSRKDVETFFSTFDEVNIEPQEFHERGDCIAVFIVMRMRPRGSSATGEIRIGNVWMMRDGKPCRLEIYPEPDRALRAAERTLEPARPWD
jgi:ketosteroid isomerase-like protein